MKCLVTGGAGFIGSNLAYELMKKGYEVTVFDNFSRNGSRHNAEWLKSFNKKINVIEGDVRNFSQIKDAVKGNDTVFHAAGQVAVTTSMENPKEDFEINAMGTFNVLDAARSDDAAVIFCSTNKVYGSNVNALPITEKTKRYEFSGKYENGVDENFHIDSEHHSPYGVSKLVGDQYVRDFGKSYGMKTVVNRMSCIYGTRQFGSSDQGWLSHFIQAFLFNKPLTVYGDGKQVRDVLFVTDLADLFIREAEYEKKLSSEVFNVGGGKSNTLSLIELMEELKILAAKELAYKKEGWRPADQKVYYSDISKATKIFGWSPRVSPKEGVRTLFEWTKNNENYFIQPSRKQQLC